jgi:hypothetical protein
MVSKVEPLAKVTYTLIAYALIIGLTRCWLNFFTRHKAKYYKEISLITLIKADCADLIIVIGINQRNQRLTKQL